MAYRAPLRASARLAALLIAVLCALTPRASADGGGWIDGRATFYDDNQQGSCHFGNQIPEMYAAWPDTLEGFEGSCGTCLEVACVNKDFSDSFGSWQQRSNACYDEGRTVVVKIVDSCPCVHPNYHSNQRWCCGDMKHLDLGRAAFNQLSPEHYGVIGLKWRQVDCSEAGGVPVPVPAPAPAPASDEQQQQGGWQEPEWPTQSNGEDGSDNVDGGQWEQGAESPSWQEGVQQKVGEWKDRVSSAWGGVVNSWVGQLNSWGR